MLDEFIASHRTEIIDRCRAKVEARLDCPAASTASDRGVPMFLDQLLSELRHGPAADSAISTTASQHGHDLLVQGYSLSQVVHDYGDVCQAVTELALERQAVIDTGDFRTLNRCLDDAIASAVTEFGRERDQRDGRQDASEGAKRAQITRDLLKTLEIAKVALEVIRSGKVGVAGTTGTVLSLGIDTAVDLAERLREEASPRMTVQGIP